MIGYITATTQTGVTACSLCWEAAPLSPWPLRGRWQNPGTALSALLALNSLFARLPYCTRRAVSWLVLIYVEDVVLRSWGLVPHWPPLTLNLWCHVVAPHSSPLKKSLQADKSSFSDAYVCVFVLYQSTRGPKDDKWALSGWRQS